MTSTNPTNDPESDPNSEIAKKISEELAKVDIHNTAKIKELAQKTMALLTEDFKSRSENPKYTVYVDDNYHYMDEDERYTLGVFDTEEEAVRAAKNVIDKFLPDTCTPGTTAEFWKWGWKQRETHSIKLLRLIQGGKLNAKTRLRRGRFWWEKTFVFTSKKVSQW